MAQTNGLDVQGGKSTVVPPELAEENASWVERVKAVLRTAAAAGRRMLFEHEVYEILAALGLTVPRYALVRDVRQVDEGLLAALGPELVLKVVSPQILHKQRVGGVKRIHTSDPLYVQFALERMREDVLGHFPDARPEIHGFLLVECVPHTQALGYEVLIGFKADPAFGPVLTLTKGGDDAEFFARHFDPANLFLPPLDEAAALRVLQGLNIRYKFEDIGHLEYLGFMARATAALSALAERFSFAHDRAPEFVFQSFEVNPFVIAGDGRFVALDGLAQFLPAAETEPPPAPVDTRNLASFFRPQGIAVVGVSADLAKQSLGREIARLLHDLGRRDLFLINPRGGTLAFGTDRVALCPSLRDVPGRVELVVYAAPMASAIEFVRELGGGPVQAVILISGVPASIRYADFARDLRAATPAGVRLIGPNCMGVFHGPAADDPGLNTLFIEEQRLEVRASPRSNTVLLTQSGAFSVTEIDRLRGARLFRTIVSFGNRLDVKLADLVAHFLDAEGIDLIALYLEGLGEGEGRQLFELARGSAKPIIAYKSGRTEAGARAAASHTASLTGSYDVFKAACAQAKIILAESIEDHYDYVKTFSLLAGKPPRGARVAGVVNAGFESTVGADELKNLRQAQLSSRTVARLNEINRFGLVDTASPFLDITPMADDRMYADFVQAILEDANVDCVFVAIVPHAPTLKTTPETCRDPGGLAALLVGLSRAYAKPMVVSVNAGRHYQDFVSIMEEEGLPVYTDIRAAIRSLDCFVTYHLGRPA